MTNDNSIFYLDKAAEVISRALNENFSASDLLMLGIEGRIAIGTIHFKDYAHNFYNRYKGESDVEPCSIPLTLLDHPYYLDENTLKKLASCDSEYENATLIPDPEWARKINAWHFGLGRYFEERHKIRYFASAPQKDEQDYPPRPLEPELQKVDLKETGYRLQPEYRDLEKSGLVRRSDLVITQQEIKHFVDDSFGKPAKATSATKTCKENDHSKSWHVNPVKKTQGYTQALYDTLTAEWKSENAKPTAAGVLDIWRQMDALPNGVVEVRTNTFVYATEEGSNTATLKALSQAIRRRTE